jgi:adenylate cyclase
MDTADEDQELRDTLTEAALLDPNSPQVDPRMTALQLLLDRGATMVDLQEHRDDLGLLAARLANGGLPTMTRRQLAGRIGISLELVDRLFLAAGLPDPGPDVLSADDSDVVMFETFAAGSAIYGEEVAFQLARVVGAATARVADSLASAFIAVVEPKATKEDASGLGIVQANLGLAELFPALMAVIAQLFRRHLVNLARPPSVTPAVGYETQDLVVGFVDLVGSTGLASRLDSSELGVFLSDFEATAADIVVRHRGRVVKFIGDEIMFTAPDPTAGVAAAVEMVEALSGRPRLPPVRAGLAYGSVLTRDGDCFGPVVNLAARIVGIASAGMIVINEGLSAHVSRDGWSVKHLGTHSLKGFDDPVPVFHLARAV